MLCNLGVKLRSNRHHKLARIRFNIDRLKDSKMSHIYVVTPRGKTGYTIVRKLKKSIATLNIFIKYVK